MPGKLLLLLVLLAGPLLGAPALDYSAHLSGEQSHPTLVFTLKNPSQRPQTLNLPAGTAMVPTEFVIQEVLTAVFLAQDLDVQLEPGQTREISVPGIPQGLPAPGYYLPSHDPGFRKDSETVRQALAQSRQGRVTLAHPQAAMLLARYGLLAHDRSLESLRPQMQQELGQSNLVEQLQQDLAVLMGLAPPPQPSPSPVARSEVRLVGSASYQSDKGQLTLTLPEVRYDAASQATSGTLKVTLWATTQGEYRGGRLTGYRFWEQSLGRLSGGARLLDLKLTRAITYPPSGDYNIVLTIEEYRNDGYVVVDWRNFKNRWKH